ncbi:MAG TPA: ABC transporter substrate-binding protein [Candidatus Acidoferrales bacterium]|nr:ABC transporter substrate-binding protein [Candidatus Acidoferrales bacterium]
MRCRASKLLLPALAAAAILAGCKNASEQSNTFKIGVITSLTGPAAAFGQAHKGGYTIAVEELNARGGLLGKQIELVYYDDQSRPDQAVQGVSKLVDQDHVPIILGAYTSENTRAIVPAVTQKQVPLLIPTAVADNVMETGSPWVFRVCEGSGAYARATLDFLKNNGDPKTLAIIYENTNFGQANDKSMHEAAEKAGLKLEDEEAYQASSPDYKTLLQRAKAKNPEVVYFASYLLDATTLMRQAAEVGLNPRYYTAAGTGFSAAEFPTDKGAGAYAEYTISVSQWLPTAKWKGSREFDEAFTKLTGSHPAYHAMEAYAVLLVTAAAVHKAGNAQPAAIRDAIRTVDLPDTPFGPIKFDEHGQNAHPVLITQILKGQYRVVWPKDAAEAEPVIPAPPWNKRP